MRGELREVEAIAPATAGLKGSMALVLALASTGVPPATPESTPHGAPDAPGKPPIGPW